jgi:hypothetical protein
MTLAFTSTVFAEIMEGIRVECKDLDGKKMCKPIKMFIVKHCTTSSQGIMLLYFYANAFVLSSHNVSPTLIKLVDLY